MAYIANRQLLTEDNITHVIYYIEEYDIQITEMKGEDRFAWLVALRAKRLYLDYAPTFKMARKHAEEYLARHQSQEAQ